MFNTLSLALQSPLHSCNVHSRSTVDLHWRWETTSGVHGLQVNQLRQREAEPGWYFQRIVMDVYCLSYNFFLIA